MERKPCTNLTSTLTPSPNGPKEIPHDPRHLGVPSRASKMIYEPMVRPAQTMHLSCTDTNPASKRKEVRFHMTHVTYEFHRVHPKRLPSLWYVRRKPCTYLASRLALSPNGPKRASTKPRHLVVPLGVSKTICKPMVHLAQTMHRSCTDTNVVSKRRAVRFHMTHVT